MKPLISLFCVVMTICIHIVSVGASATVPANSSDITYIGRWGDLTVGGSPVKVAISGGLRSRFKFTGTSCSMQFDLTSYTYKSEISWSIDGGAFTRQAVSLTSITLASGLVSGAHTVDIWVEGTGWNNSRWTSFDGVRIIGVTLDSGASLTAWPLGAAGRILVIGDSIAEGQLALGSTPLSYEPSLMSGRLAFPAVVAGALNLELWDHAFGGTGFYGTMSSGAIPATNLSYPYKMAGISQSDPHFDIVLIEAGSNDGQANIQAAYNSLLTQIIADQPTAKLFCMGLLIGPTEQSHIKAAATAKGCTYIPTSDWVYSKPNIGHPDAAGHASIAAY